MAKSRCLPLVRGKVLRVTRLDGCGRPVYGDDSVGVTSGFVSVQFTQNTSESDSITVTNADGENRVNVPSKTTLSNYTVQVQFCVADPAVLSLITGQNVVVDGETGDIIGFDVESGIDPSKSGWALEVWTGAGNTDQCDPETQGNFGYILVPFLQGGTLGDYTIENGAVNFSVSNAQTIEGAAWGVGPYDVQVIGGVAAPLSKPVSAKQHQRVLLSKVAEPPEGYCGLRPLLDPGDADVTSITATQSGGDPFAYTFKPTPNGNDPMWYDFGDGTWDYAPNGTITHAYDSTGTYTVTGHRGSAAVSTTVTVSGS